MARRTYPHQGHILRHLELSHRRLPDGSLTATMPAYADLCDPDGFLRLGAVATLVDSVAGQHGVLQVRPDWVATLHLGTVIDRAAEGNLVTALCSPLRVGRNNLVTETVVSDDRGEFGRSLCTYARLPARADNPAGPGEEEYQVDFREDEPLDPRPPLDEYLQVRPRPSDAVVDLDHHSRIYNSFGSIQGGAVVVLMEIGGTHLAGLLSGRRARCIGADVHYLSQARGGPFEVRAERIATAGDVVVSRVRIIDVGSDDRLLSVATVTTELTSDDYRTNG